MLAEGLELQKLQHGWRQRLGNAIDLIQEKYAFVPSRLPDMLVNGGNDLAHGVMRDAIRLALELVFDDIGKTQSTLTRVMRHRIGDKTDAHFLGDLRHNRRLANARRPHQQNGPLAFCR